ncbi:serine/threonine-protein kinase [Polyangium aurulentum]|uniref:serine/threonine-protein kinase n=1 Tax=Polyangium aurulentum TaxID=2567896 RepID=UPI0010AE2DC2|nr:serine/threonine-protein kinase [Polyangium aurulentum]UQA56168.1 serine/threonine protein kinase [Polyangium aurulentum]
MTARMAGDDPDPLAHTRPVSSGADDDMALGATVPLERPSNAGDALSTSSRVGRLVLLRKLGEGAMGVVYAAYDEALDRRVAVKVLKSGGATSDWLVREAQALAKLSHPNVVPVYDVGKHEDSLFLAMEFVEGRTLRAFAEEPGRSLEDVVRALVGAGRGLAAAHEAGLVHRDFKPENVLVGEDRRARVVDFGLAGLSVAAAEPARSGRARPNALRAPLTMPGTLLGTPVYMAPEQFHGERATAASDQWSFAISLYELAYGQRPFDGEQLAQLAVNVVEGRLRPPPANTTAPPWIFAVAKRGLALDPKDRYPSLAAMVDAMEAHLPRAQDDPSQVRREQGILFGTLIVYATGITAYKMLRGHDNAFFTPWDQVRLGLLFFAVSTGAVALVWKKLRVNKYGRRLAGLFAATPAMITLHRVVAAVLGTPVLHTLVMDMFLASIGFLLTAVAIDRRLAIAPIIGFLGVFVAAFNPALAPILFGAVGVVGLGLGVYVWGRPRPNDRIGDARTPSTPGGLDSTPAPQSSP